tara:strand:- start:6521 stop:6763 length:243 start_codon:yes stop_codon:yes gene_type:complete
MKNQKLPYQKLTKQKSKLLCKQIGGELDNMIYGSMIEKMRKGGNAKRLSRNNETGQESMQEYKLGGGTHNTYSGPSKKKK